MASVNAVATVLGLRALLILGTWLACQVPVFPVANAQETVASPRPASHPLSGNIWDTRASRSIDAVELNQRLASVTFILLGEIHDNAVHHRLQHELVAALVHSGRRPAIAMEQFDRERQSALDNARAERPLDQEHLKRAAQFNDKGWEWEFYAPIVALALQYALPLLAANLSRATAFDIVSAGLESLGNPQVRDLGLDQPLERARREQLERVIHEGHCGQAPPQSLAGMADAQRARDAVMAQTIAAHRERGAVLIAGNGHVRRDFGVPYYLQRLAPGASVASIGLIEIRPGDSRPEDYYAAADPEFDYLWFTPRTAREDPCLQLKFKRQ